MSKSQSCPWRVFNLVGDRKHASKGVLSQKMVKSLERERKCHEIRENAKVDLGKA